MNTFRLRVEAGGFRLSEQGPHLGEHPIVAGRLEGRPASRITPGRLASTRRGDDDRERSDAQTDRESFDQHAREPVALQRLSVSEHDKPIASGRGVSSRIGPSEFVDLRGAHRAWSVATARWA